MILIQAIKTSNMPIDISMLSAFLILIANSNHFSRRISHTPTTHTTPEANLKIVKK